MRARYKTVFLALAISFVIFFVAFGTPFLSLFTAAKVLTWAECMPAGFDSPAIRCPNGGGFLSTRFAPLTFWFTTLFAPLILVKQCWDVMLGWLTLVLIFGRLTASDN